MEKISEKQRGTAMKRWMLLLVILWMLPGTGLAAMEIEAKGVSPYTLGDQVEFTVTAAPGDSCRYTLMRGNKTVFEGEETAEFAGLVRPRQAGDYTLIAQSGPEEARYGFSVTREPLLAPVGQLIAANQGLRMDGSRATVMGQGDVRKYTVHSDGPWTAETEDDFILLSGDCGMCCESLYITILPTAQNRQGRVTFTCGQETAVLEINQVAGHGAEEEITFAPVEDFIFIDGEGVETCFLTGDEVHFTVESSGPWAWESDGDFITITKTEDGLSVRPETGGDALQKACITLSCGVKNAYLYVYQVPEEKGAGVLSAIMAQDTVTAYDGVQADVLCDPDTERLTVSAPGYQDVFPAADWARETEEGLFFQVDVPLSGEGKQMILFAGENAEGSGKKQRAYVEVVPEGPAFACDAGVFTQVGSRRDVQFTTTAAVEKGSLLDEEGNLLAAFTSSDGQRAYAGEGGEKERYVLWTLPVAQEEEPAFVQLENSRIPLEKRTLLTPSDIQLHSQMDGWWQDKKYSISQLEQSGCAVFALSHALQLLGYTGEEIQPENLAKAYAMALMKDGSGTMNSSLVGRAGDDFGFKTRYELYENPNTIRDKAAQGAVFTFSVVNGHIACVADVAGDKCLIIDSAPSATFERKGTTPVYVQDETGLFVPVDTPAEIPGVSYCPETDSYGCAVYYLDLSYVARRGVRLIQPE